MHAGLLGQGQHTRRSAAQPAPLTKVEQLLDEEGKLPGESDAVHLAHAHQVQQEAVHLAQRCG